jgi:fatty-acid desaturase
MDFEKLFSGLIKVVLFIIIGTVVVAVSNVFGDGLLGLVVLLLIIATVILAIIGLGEVMK